MMDQHRAIAKPSLHVVLLHPEVPANTGNIARLCGAAQIRLHLVHPLGFEVDDKHLKRAGLDYWHEVDIRHHQSFEAFLKTIEGGSNKLLTFSARASQYYTSAKVEQGDYLLFGKESTGLPSQIRSRYPCYGIPVWGKVRSLNLSTAVGIVVYHYLYEMGTF
jgi:tRNA (cytidine/uridine-2'-O-)-methyltransferase